MSQPPLKTILPRLSEHRSLRCAPAERQRVFPPSGRASPGAAQNARFEAAAARAQSIQARMIGSVRNGSIDRRLRSALGCTGYRLAVEQARRLLGVGSNGLFGRSLG